MASLCLKDISFRYHSAVSVFDRLNLQFSEGFCGVVGENGSGKSTLLRLIAGEILPDQGSFIQSPSGMKVHYCVQELFESSAEIDEFMWNYEKEACRLKHELQLNEEDVSRFGTLSPGERKKWQIGAALCSQSDILMLDEPGNHIDTFSENLILNVLKRFRGIGIIVSHHRKWLDSLTNQTVWISPGKVEVYPKPYSLAKELRDRAREREGELLDAAKRQVKMLSQQLNQAKARSASAENSKKNVRKSGDSDSRTIAAGNQADWALARLSRDVSVLQNKKQRAEENSPKAPEKILGSSIFWNYEPSPSRMLFQIRENKISAGEKFCFSLDSFQLERNGRIHLKGPNGSGKSTFLKYLIQEGKISGDKVLYLPQEYSEKDVDTVLEEVKNLPPKVKGRVMTLFASLGGNPEKLLESSRLSPGEVRKLHLAVALGKEVWLLVMDEPTNHLDLPSVERLEHALCLFPGALFLVSHDEVFAKKCTERTFVIEEGKLREVFENANG